jgi:hypothetical protein
LKCSWSITYWDWIKGIPTLREPNASSKTVSLTQQGRIYINPNQYQPQSPRQISAHVGRVSGTHRRFHPPTGSHERQGGFHGLISLVPPTYNPRHPDLSSTNVYPCNAGMPYLHLRSTMKQELDQRTSRSIGCDPATPGNSPANWPKAIRHGSTQLGGLGLCDLRTELGIAQIKFFRESVITGKEPGRLLLIQSATLTAQGWHPTTTARAARHLHSILDTHVDHITTPISIQP